MLSIPCQVDATAVANPTAVGFDPAAGGPDGFDQALGEALVAAALAQPVPALGAAPVAEGDGSVERDDASASQVPGLEGTGWWAELWINPADTLDLGVWPAGMAVDALSSGSGDALGGSSAPVFQEGADADGVPVEGTAGQFQPASIVVTAEPPMPAEAETARLAVSDRADGAMNPRADVVSAPGRSGEVEGPSMRTTPAWSTPTLTATPALAPSAQAEDGARASGDGAAPDATGAPVLGQRRETSDGAADTSGRVPLGDLAGSAARRGESREDQGGSPETPAPAGRIPTVDAKAAPTTMATGALESATAARSHPAPLGDDRRGASAIAAAALAPAAEGSMSGPQSAPRPDGNGVSTSDQQDPAGSRHAELTLPRWLAEAMPARPQAAATDRTPGVEVSTDVAAVPAESEQAEVPPVAMPGMAMVEAVPAHRDAHEQASSIPAAGAFASAGTGVSDSGATPRITPTSASLVLAPPASDDVVVPQLVRAFRLHGRDGVGEARVQLEPHHLGAVTIALRIEHGTVSAVITAERAAVRQWIETHEQGLRDGLAQHGLGLFRLRVEADGQRQSGEEPRREAWPRPRRARRETATFELVA